MFKPYSLVLTLNGESEDAIVVVDPDTGTGVVAFDEIAPESYSLATMECKLRSMSHRRETLDVLVIDSCTKRLYDHYEEGTGDELLSPERLFQLLLDPSGLPYAPPYLVEGDGVLRDSGTGLALKS